MKFSHAIPALATRATRLACGGAGLALAALLGACSSSPPLFLPDGRPTVLVQCPVGSDSCAQQARANCGGQYQTVSQSGNNGTMNLIYACPATNQ
jgi:hypothetical protein